MFRRPNKKSKSKQGKLIHTNDHLDKLERDDLADLEDATIFSRFFHKLYRSAFKKMNLARQVLIWYLLISILGALLLWMPITHTSQANANGSVTFINALFTSASAFSDTGLIVFSTANTFNGFGQAIIFILFTLGGIGWFAIKVFLVNYFISRRINYKTKSTAFEELGTGTAGQTIGVIKVAIWVIIIATLVIGTILGIIFATVPASNPSGFSTNYTGPNPNGPTTQYLYGNWGESMWTGYFMAGSAINNAGFDIIHGGNSLAPYIWNYGIQILIMFLFILGGIGFSVIYDIKEYAKNSYKHQKFHFSILTKISVITYFLVAFVGLGLVFLFEGIQAGLHPQDALLLNQAYGGGFARTWVIVFNTFSTRNAGFSTINLNVLSTGSLMVYVTMMFIGSGPGSTSGGIRTTTFAILAVATWSYLRGHKDTEVMKRKISDQKVREAFIIFGFSLLLVFVGIFILTASIQPITPTNPGYGSNGYIPIATEFQIIFTVVSAFGTTGLSVFNLNNMTVVGKLTIIFIMFVGQLGIATTIKQFRAKQTKKHGRSYIEEDVSFG